LDDPNPRPDPNENRLPLPSMVRLAGLLPAWLQDTFPKTGKDLFGYP